MADKKENELTSANNFEWVRALDSKGNSIRISKSDLVSVLEGLMSVATETNNGLLNKEYAAKTVKIDSGKSYDIGGYSVVLVRETEFIGIVAIIVTFWNTIDVVSTKLDNAILSFQSNRKGGLTITNNGTNSLTLTLRCII